MIDWYRMFFGDGDWIFLAEIAIRTSLMYLFALLMVRIMGKRGMAQLTPFEFVIIVALGSAVGDPMFYPDVPLLHGFVVIATVVACQRLLSLSTRVPRVEEMVAGRPFVVIEDGVVRGDTLDEERFSLEEIHEMLRLAGVARMADVEKAIIEDAGRLSVLMRSDRGPADPELWSVDRPPA